VCQNPECGFVDTTQIVGHYQEYDALLGDVVAVNEFECAECLSEWHVDQFGEIVWSAFNTRL
jgi:hypothetical protein